MSGTSESVMVAYTHKYAKGLGMHLVTYTNRDMVPFLLLVQYKGGLSEIELTVTLFSNVGMILLSSLKILCISSYIKGGIAHFLLGDIIKLPIEVRCRDTIHYYGNVREVIYIFDRVDMVHVRAMAI